MKNELIEMAYKYDADDESLTQYEDKMLEILNQRIDQLKKISSNEWNMFADASYELFNGYKFLIEALDSNGLASRAIKYTKEVLEYSAMYSKYVDTKYMAIFSEYYLSILKKYKVTYD